jgi:hypothetical protein
MRKRATAQMLSATSLSASNPSGIRKINPLEISDWDELVGVIPGAGFFHSQAWAQVLHETYGYEPCYQVVIAPGRIHGLLPLMEVDSWLTGRRGVALPFTDEIEPLCDTLPNFRAVFESAVAFARSQRWKYIEIRGGKKWLPEAPPSTSFFQHSLDLCQGESSLFANCEDSVRRAVRKAERSGLQVEFSQSMLSMRRFYDLLCLTRRRHGVPPQPFSFFANIQRQVLETGKGWVVLAYKGTLPVAGAVFFHFGREVIYKFGASDETHQHLRANNLVMWRAIQHYAHKESSSMCFGRTSFLNKGLRSFKLAWGTSERETEYVRLGPLGAFQTASDGTTGWHNKLFQRLPAPVSRLAGALLYRHIA